MFTIGRARYHRAQRKRAAPGSRVALSLGLLLAFYFFSYVTQTHIHIPALERVAESKVPDSGGHHKRPIEDDTAHCPLCQAAVNSGSFVAAIAPALPVPLVLSPAEFLPVSFVLGGMTRSHGWKSRAPPRL